MNLGEFMWILVDLGEFRLIPGERAGHGITTCGGLWQPVARESWPLNKQMLGCPKLDDWMTRCFDASGLEAWRHGGWQLGW